MARRSSTFVGLQHVIFCLVSLVLIFSVASAYEQSSSPTGNGSRTVSPAGTVAKPLFLAARSIAVSGKPAAIAAVDLNNDGQVDLVVANAETGTVDVFLAIGRGTFGPARKYYVGASPSAILVADFNGDGNLDVAVADSANSVSVLLGNGDGTLQAPKAYKLSGSAVFLAARDFHRKGKPDLLAAIAGGTSISMLANNGDGSFASAQQIAIGAEPQAIAVGDFNGDGKQDFASANANGSLTVVLGDGAGGFTNSRSYLLGASLSAVVAADFDRDGHIDLAVTDSANDSVQVMKGAGDGTFQPFFSVPVGHGPASLAVADFNQDGIFDLAVANRSSNTVSVLVGNGDGSFHPSGDFVVGNAPKMLAIADFNGDGHPDLVTANFVDGTVSIPLGIGDGTFQAARSFRSISDRGTLNQQSTTLQSIAAGDLDGDGHADLVVSNFCSVDNNCSGDGAATVFFGDGKGGFRQSTAFPLTKGAVAISLADVNGDKKLDLISINRNDNSLSVMLGNGDGTFQQGISFALGKTPVAMAVGDLNHDGKIDLVVATQCASPQCSQPGEAVVLLGNGDGNFRVAATYTVGFSPVSVAIGDLNGDGNMDVAVANACGASQACANGSASILMGDGLGGFRPEPDRSLGVKPSSVAIGRLRPQGAADLVAAYQENANVGVLLGNGNGSFQDQVLYPVGTGPSSLIVGNFKGDGNLDVAVANLNSSTVSVLAGNGDGTLQSAVHFPVGSTPVAIISANLGAGRKADIVSVSPSDSATNTSSNKSVTVLQNLSVALLGPATRMSVAGYPSPTTAGVSHTFTVTAQDGSGNTDTGYTGTVTFTSSDPQAVLPADSTLTNGTGTFTVTLKTAGTQSITATDTVIASITGNQTSIQVNSAAATTLAVTGYPSPTTAGVSQTFTVTAQDANGNTDTAYAGIVHFTSSDPQAALPANSGLTNGTRTFNATLKTAGLQSITATDTVTASITGNQTGIQVNSAAATTLVVTRYPSPTTAGVSQTFTVTAQDANGNTDTAYAGIVHFTSSDPQAVLPANSGLTNGTGTFTATLKKVGTRSITATDTVTASITGSQTGIQVNSAAATILVVTGYPSPTTAGVSQTFTVTAQDANGNTDTAYAGIVHFTSSDPQAVLPANSGLTNGTGTFSATLKKAGTRSITGTDTVVSSITGSQTGIQVNSAAATILVVTGYPSPTTAGVSQTFTVTAQDAFGNTATGYTGIVHFTSSDPQGMLPADSGLTNGTSAFIATLKKVGTRSITATDTVTASITGSQTGIQVNPAPAITLVVTGYPSPTTAGVSQMFTVTAQDANGNTDTAYAGIVHFTSSDARAVLPANGLLTNGTRTFNATLKTAGLQSITGTDTVVSSITGSQTGIQVNPAAATKLIVAGYPSPTIAGQAHSFTVTAQDAFGNTDPGYAGIVHFTSSDPQAVLPADSGLTNGTSTFTATLKKVGTRSITGTDTVTASITGSQTGIQVNPAPAVTLVVTGYPSPTTAGVSQTFTVTAQDANGNTDTGYAGTVHFTSSDPQAVLPTDSGLTNGTGIFTATLKKAGTQSITGTDTLVSSITGSQTGIQVSPAAVTTFVVAGYPSPTTAGVSQPFTVMAFDAFGNLATNYAGTLHFTSDRSAVLPANSGLINGAGTFNAALNKAGTRSITVTDTKTSVSGSQTGIQVGSAAATTLVVTGYPSPTTAGVSQTFTVTAEDNNQNIDTAYKGILQFTSSDPQAVLPIPGTLTNGTFTFTATLKTATLQSITATDSVIASIKGAQTGIQVIPAAAAILKVTGFLSPTIVGQSQIFNVTAFDPFTNIATGYPGLVHFTSSDASAVLPANSGLTNGMGTFSATLNKAGAQSITGTDTVTASITGSQTPIQVGQAATSTSIMSSLNPSTLGVPITLAATVANTSINSVSVPTGSVTFMDGSTPIGTANLNPSGANGVAMLAVSSLQVTGASHMITAVYTNGDGNFINGSSGPLSQTVKATSGILAATSITAKNDPANGAFFTLTAVATPQPGFNVPPSGVVKFIDSATSAEIGSDVPLGNMPCPSPAPANASCAVLVTPAGQFSPGSHVITASYNGNASFFGNSSQTAITVLNAIQTSAGVAIPATNIHFDFTGSSDTLAMQCSVLSSPLPNPLPLSFPKCSLSSNSLTLTQSAGGDISVTISTVAGGNHAALPGAPALFNLSTSAVGILGIVIAAGFNRRKGRPRGKLRAVLGMISVLCIFMLLLGCGGGFNNPNQLQPQSSSSTAPGTYVVTITGTDPAQQNANGGQPTVAATVAVNVGL